MSLIHTVKEKCEYDEEKNGAASDADHIHDRHEQQCAYEANERHAGRGNEQQAQHSHAECELLRMACRE